MRGFGFILLAILTVALAPLGDAARAAGIVGTSGADGWMVLCTELGAVTVAMGPDGTPLDGDETPAPPAARHCPDCLPVPQPAGPVPAAVLSQRPPAEARPLWTAPRTTARLSRSLPLPAARGPPVVS